MTLICKRTGFRCIITDTYRFYMSTGLIFKGPYLHGSQCVYNIYAVAQLVTIYAPLERNMLHLRSMSWLPVQFQVQFKELVLKFKALHGMRPDYLRDHLPLITFEKSHQILQKRYAAGPGHPEATIGRSQEMGLFCHGAQLMESFPPLT